MNGAQQQAAGRQRYHLVEALRRLANVVRPGTVAAVDLASARVRVQYAGGADEPVLTGWVPWMARRAGGAIDWDPPTVDEQVVLLAPNGDLSQAFALGAAYSNDRAAPSEQAGLHTRTYGDGAVVSYDENAHRLSAVLPEGGTARVNAPDGLSIAGDVAVDGAITATGNVHSDGDIEDSRGTMQSMRATYNNHTHASNGAAPPAQRMQ